MLTLMLQNSRSRREELAAKHSHLKMHFKNIRQRIKWIICLRYNKDIVCILLLYVYHVVIAVIEKQKNTFDKFFSMSAFIDVMPLRESTRY
jgi:hypothetical protein